MQWLGAWVRAHKLISVGLVILVLVILDLDEESSDPLTDDSASAVTESNEDSSVADREGRQQRARKPDRAHQADRNPGKDRGHELHRSGGHASKKNEPAPDEKVPQTTEKPTFLVTRVIDGDTIELSNGEDVRVVGIDTPEVGECHYVTATNHMASLTLNRQVTLTVSDEDRDYYGRLLRYVDVNGVDAGLSQIRHGLAIARYDSRDGYGFHPRESRYIAADGASRQRTCAPSPAPAAKPAGNCAPGYDPCVPSYPPDVDCADVAGPISVTGADPHGLDGEGDGIACE